MMVRVDQVRNEGYILGYIGHNCEKDRYCVDAEQRQGIRKESVSFFMISQSYHIIHSLRPLIGSE